ncbi:MAG: hypothetical protein IPK82_10300 [Polyangiaceae bacterium]|nr:hypothetical protein [Polyangiaceae bacterium]
MRTHGFVYPTFFVGMCTYRRAHPCVQQAAVGVGGSLPLETRTHRRVRLASVERTLTDAYTRAAHKTKPNAVKRWACAGQNGLL